MLTSSDHKLYKAVSCTGLLVSEDRMTPPTECDSHSRREEMTPPGAKSPQVSQSCPKNQVFDSKWYVGLKICVQMRLSSHP